MFRVFDTESLGYLSPITLKAVTNGEVDNETIEQLVEMADSDEEGDIHYEGYLEDMFEDTSNMKKKF